VQKSLLQYHTLQTAQAKINELQQQTILDGSNDFLTKNTLVLAATRAAGLPAGSLNRKS